MAPAAAPALGVTPAAVGYFVTVVYLGSMIGTVTAGGWVGRFGPILVSQAGLALCCAGLAVAASGALPAVLIGALLLGLGFLAFAKRGVTGPVEGAWARRTMLYSIAWLAALMLSLVAFAR